MTLLLTDRDVGKAVKPIDVVEAIEDGFRQYGLGLAQTLPRREVRILKKELPSADTRMTFVMQGLAFLEESQVVGIQHILNFPDKRSPGMKCVNFLVSALDGSVLAVVDSMLLVRMRTGATGAVGARYLARDDSKIASIVGSGRQGRLALRFLCQVRRIEKAYAYSLVPEETEKFCGEMSAELGIQVLPSTSIEQMVKEADIVITATQSMAPIVRAEWLSPGVHVNIIGADDAPKIELEGVALKRADKFVIAGEDCFLTGQFSIPKAQGIISYGDVYGTIGEIITGRKPARESKNEITIFHSPGLTVQDAAAVYKVYIKAKELGLGVNIPDPLNYS